MVRRSVQTRHADGDLRVRASGLRSRKKHGLGARALLALFGLHAVAAALGLWSITVAGSADANATSDARVGWTVDDALFARASNNDEIVAAPVAAPIVHAPEPIPVAHDIPPIPRPYWNIDVPRDEGRLRVVVLLPDGSKARGLRVWLRAEDPVFKPGFYPRRFTRRWLQSSIRVKGIIPGAPFELIVEDAYWQPIASAGRLVLRGGEDRTVEVTLPRAPNTLIVEVVDPSGVPVPLAFVQALSGKDPPAGAAGKRLVSSPTWPARFRGVFGESVTLRLNASGFKSTQLEDVRVPDSGEPLQVVMQPSRKLHVLVQGRWGQPAEARWVEAIVDGVRYDGIPGDAPGLWEFENLPGGELEVRVDMGRYVEVVNHHSLVPMIMVRVDEDR